MPISPISPPISSCNAIVGRPVRRAEVRRFRAVAIAVATATLVAALSPTAVTAAEWTTDKAETRARLIAGESPPAASAFGASSSAVMAAVEIELAKGWKTYWRFPGDAGGVPPMFDWSKSANVKSARVLYPAPDRIADKMGDILGYQSRVTLPVVIEPIDPTKPVALDLKLDYGVCREICIPVEAEFTSAIPSAGRDLLPAPVAAALERVPRSVAMRRPADPKLVGTKITLNGDKPQLTIDAEFPGGAASADVYVESPDGYYIPLAKPKSGKMISGDILRFEIDLAGAVEPAQIRGKQALVTLVSERGRSEVPFTFE